MSLSRESHAASFPFIAGEFKRTKLRQRDESPGEHGSEIIRSADYSDG